MASQTDEMEAHLDELRKKFDRLKVLYEQYFMGIEKMEPATARNDLSRAMLDLQQKPLRNTSLRFKAATLIQKWNIYQSYWSRTMREIESGRYLRHVATARRHAAEQGLEFPAQAMGLQVPALPGQHPPGETPVDRRRKANDGNGALGGQHPPGETPVDRAAQALPEPAAARALPPPTGAPPSWATPVPGLSEAELRALHGRIVEAQRAAGEPTPVRYEVLVSQLARQVPKLMAEHRCSALTFEVVTKDGKVRLKPKPQH